MILPILMVVMSNTPLVTIGGVNVKVEDAGKVVMASEWISERNQKVSKATVDSLAAGVYLASREFGLPMATILAVIYIECSGNPRAQHPYLPKYNTRARGPMGVVRRFHNIPKNVDLEDPILGVLWGSKILVMFMHDYGHNTGLYRYSGRTKGYVQKYYRLIRTMDDELFEYNGNDPGTKDTYKMCIKAIRRA